MNSYTITQKQRRTNISLTLIKAAFPLFRDPINGELVGSFIQGGGEGAAVPSVNWNLKITCDLYDKE